MTERVITLPLRKLSHIPRPQRAKRAVALVRKQVFKHFRVAAKDVNISHALNQKIWERGREKPPFKITLRVEAKDKKATVLLPEEKAPKKEKPAKAKTKEKPTEKAKEKETPKAVAAPKEKEAKPSKEKKAKPEKKKTEEEAVAEAVQKERLKEKRTLERAAEKAAIKRKTNR